MSALHCQGSTQGSYSNNASIPSLHALPYLGIQSLGQGIWAAALALFLSVSTSILVFPFFPYIPSSGYFGDALPQVGQRVYSTILALTDVLASGLCFHSIAFSKIATLTIAFAKSMTACRVLQHP